MILAWISLLSCSVSGRRCSSVVEQADRCLAEGVDRWEAFQRASIRMAWPVITSTITTLAVFLPMLFWPGLIGELMFFLPATVLVTLCASLLVARALLVWGARGRVGCATDRQQPVGTVAVGAVEIGGRRT
jgi:multidrug efflux pump